MTANKREYMRAYAHKESRKAYMRTYLKEWRKKNKDKIKHYNEKWEMNNPEVYRISCKKKQKKYRDTHPEYRARATKRMIKWAKSNPEKHKINIRNVGHRYRARKYNTTVGSIDYSRILIDSCGICGICEKYLDSSIEYDHIIPIARGGSHTQDNLQATHALCNHKKSSRLPEEFKQVVLEISL